MWRFACLSLLAAVAPAHADVRGVVRFGLLPIELESSRDTPLFGDEIDRAVNAYNDAHAAAGSPSRISESDLGVDETLYTFAPGVEVGNSIAFFRVEGIVGYGGSLRSYGVGIYPLNLQLGLSRQVTGYVSVGGTASWLDREDADVGGLVTGRIAGGVRISKRVALEAGYSAFMLGGVVDRDALDTMPTRDTPPPEPQDVVAAGEGSGIVDLSVGVVF